MVVARRLAGNHDAPAAIERIGANAMANIFISYTAADRDWAFWIAKELEALGHIPHVQATTALPGGSGRRHRRHARRPVGLGVRLGWIQADAQEEPSLPLVMERLAEEGDGILLIYDNAPDPTRCAPPAAGARRISW